MSTIAKEYDVYVSPPQVDEMEEMANHEFLCGNAEAALEKVLNKVENRELSEKAIKELIQLLDQFE